MSLTRRTTSPVDVLATINPPVPPASTSCEFVGFGAMLLSPRVGSVTLHLTIPPRFLPPIPPSVSVHTSRSVTRICFTPRVSPPPMNGLGSPPCAGKRTFGVRCKGEQRAETCPEEVPIQRRSA